MLIDIKMSRGIEFDLVKQNGWCDFFLKCRIEQLFHLLTISNILLLSGTCVVVPYQNVNIANNQCIFL